jgi:hypothetical protein
MEPKLEMLVYLHSKEQPIRECLQLNGEHVIKLHARERASAPASLPRGERRGHLGVERVIYRFGFDLDAVS